MVGCKRVLAHSFATLWFNGVLPPGRHLSGAPVALLSATEADGGSATPEFVALQAVTLTSSAPSSSALTVPEARSRRGGNTKAGWGGFLIPSAHPRVRPMGLHRTRTCRRAKIVLTAASAPMGVHRACGWGAESNRPATNG